MNDRIKLWKICVVLTIFLLSFLYMKNYSILGQEESIQSAKTDPSPQLVDSINQNTTSVPTSSVISTTTAPPTFTATETTSSIPTVTGISTTTETQYPTTSDTSDTTQTSDCGVVTITEVRTGVIIHINETRIIYLTQNITVTTTTATLSQKASPGFEVFILLIGVINLSIFVIRRRQKK
ncbi:MAG: hypothetical protein ACXAC7_14650 [Candidatus Hodarchaeales archaeon]|jgi:hypothetical protein